MTFLYILRLSDNQLSGEIPSELDGLVNLEEPYLGELSLQGASPRA